MSLPLLAVEGLRTEFRTDRGVVRAGDGVSFAIPAGKSRADALEDARAEVGS